jgi:uncharacterized membrane protein YphA (DoxX/SURF4 family)
MTNLKIYGRVFYGLGIVGIGLLHFIFNGFRPIILPVPAESVDNISIIVYLVAIYILVSGILITIGKNVRTVSLVLGVVFFSFLLFGHLPIRISAPTAGPWIDAIKILALSGGAFVMASAFPTAAPSPFFDRLSRIAPVGKYFFATMLLLFGYSHFVSAPGISHLVPKYIPWALFWTYVGGIALVGSGTCFITNIKVKLVGLLLAVTLFLWLILLHIYYAVRFPLFQDGENIIGSFEALAFCGTTLVISLISQPPLRTKRDAEVKTEKNTSLEPAT